MPAGRASPEVDLFLIWRVSDKLSSCVPCAMERASGEPLAAILAMYEDAWVALLACVPIEDACHLATPLVRSFAAHGKDFEIVKYCVMREVIETGTGSVRTPRTLTFGEDEPVQLFRGNGINTTIIAASTQLHGRTWVQGLLAPVLTKISQRNASSFEVDPMRAGSEATARRNTLNLIDVANHVLAALLESADSMPMYVPSVFGFPLPCGLCTGGSYFSGLC